MTTIVWQSLLCKFGECSVSWYLNKLYSPPTKVFTSITFFKIAQEDTHATVATKYFAKFIQWVNLNQIFPLQSSTRCVKLTNQFDILNVQVEWSWLVPRLSFRLGVYIYIYIYITAKTNVVIFEKCLVWLQLHDCPQILWMQWELILE